MPCLFTVNISLAQTVYDNFDHYTSGEHLCPQSNNLWTTWDYNSGGLSDVYVRLVSMGIVNDINTWGI